MIRAQHLLKSSIIVILFFGLGKMTGLIRTRLVSVAFGTGSDFDAFTAANQLPEVFFTLIAGGALAAAFIPVYSAYLSNETEKKSLRLANTILNLVIIILGVISALGAIFAPWLTRVLLVPYYPPEVQTLTADIMRVILIQTTIFGVSGVLSSVLNSHQHFALPALAPVALDVGYIIGLLLFVPSMGVIGLAWGTVIGGVLHVLIQIPALIRYHFRYRRQLDIRLPGVQEIMILMLPRIVTMGTIQIADLFIIRLASGLAVGSTSGYFYAYGLMQLPETLFGTAIALVVFPTMAELYNGGDIAGLKKITVNALSIIWFLTIPAAAAMVLLGRPLIGVLLQGGEFNEKSAQLVYTVLVVFSVRIVSEATLEIFARLFYAQHNTLTPMIAYLGWLVVNIGMAFLLIDEYGIVGLALASTVAFTFLAVILFILNRRRLGSLHEKFLGKSAIRAILATIGMSFVILAVGRFVSQPFFYLVVGGLLGGFTYLVISILLGGREIQNLFKLLRKRENDLPDRVA